MARNTCMNQATPSSRENHGTGVPGQDFADTAVTDAQPAGDIAGTHAAFGELHDALPQHMR